MRFPHYRFSIFLLVHGFALAIVGLFQDETKNIALMLLGGCFMMIFGGANIGLQNKLIQTK